MPAHDPSRERQPEPGRGPAARLWPRGAWGGAALALSLGGVAAAGLAQEKTTYQEHVLPLIETHCSKCHNADKKKADLELTSYQGALRGSGSGPVLVSGSLENSRLWKCLSHAEEPFMPPNRPALPEKELEGFKKWVLGGLLENSGSQPLAAPKPNVDLSLKLDDAGKPDGPAPLPQDWPQATVVHTSRGTAITGLAASPWAPLLAVAGQKEVMVFQTDTLELLGILPFPEGQPVEVRFSRSGKLLLAAGGRAADSGRVVVWDVASGERLMTLGDEHDVVLTADARADQAQVALGGPSRLLKLLSTKTGEVLHRIKQHTDWITAVAYSPNGQMLASADRNGGLSVWDPDSGQELFTLSGHQAAVTALSWRADGKLLASASEDGTVRVWELQDGRQVKSWAAHPGGALWVVYARDGRLLTCGRDRAVALWNADGGKTRQFEFFGELPVRAAFSQDGKRVFATDYAGRVAAWDANDGKRLGELEANPRELAEQVNQAEQRLRALEVQAAIEAAAKSQLAKVAAALEQANKSLEAARAEYATKAEEVRKTQAQTTNAPAADLAAALAAALMAQQKTGEALTNAAAVALAGMGAIQAAQTNLARAQTPNLDAALAAARGEVRRLKAADVCTTLYHVREGLKAQKQDADQLQARLAAQRQALTAADNSLAAAKAAAVQAEATVQTAKTEVAKAEPLAQKAAEQVAAQEARLKQLREELGQLRK